MGCRKLCVVRHGERVDEVDGPEQREWEKSPHHVWYDPPLTRVGHQQAAKAGSTLRLMASHGRFRVIYTSPLQRAVETAVQLAEKLALPIRVVVGMAEAAAAVKRLGVPAVQPSLWTDADIAARFPHVTILPGVGRESGSGDDLATAEHQQGPQQGPETFCGALAWLSALQEEDEVLVVGHREIIRDIIGARVSTPYCCIALFGVESGQAEQEEEEEEEEGHRRASHGKEGQRKALAAADGGRSIRSSRKASGHRGSETAAAGLESLLARFSLQLLSTRHGEALVDRLGDAPVGGDGLMSGLGPSCLDSSPGAGGARQQQQQDLTIRKVRRRGYRPPHERGPSPAQLKARAAHHPPQDVPLSPSKRRAPLEGHDPSAPSRKVPEILPEKKVAAKVRALLRRLGPVMAQRKVVEELAMRLEVQIGEEASPADTERYSGGVGAAAAGLFQQWTWTPLKLEGTQNRKRAGQQEGWMDAPSLLSKPTATADGVRLFTLSSGSKVQLPPPVSCSSSSASRCFPPGSLGSMGRLRISLSSSHLSASRPGPPALLDLDLTQLGGRGGEARRVGHCSHDEATAVFSLWAATSNSTGGSANGARGSALGPSGGLLSYPPPHMLGCVLVGVEQQQQQQQLGGGRGCCPSSSGPVTFLSVHLPHQLCLEHLAGMHGAEDARNGSKGSSSSSNSSSSVRRRGGSSIGRSSSSSSSSSSDGMTDADIDSSSGGGWAAASESVFTVAMGLRSQGRPGWETVARELQGVDIEVDVPPTRGRGAGHRRRMLLLEAAGGGESSTAFGRGGDSRKNPARELCCPPRLQYSTSAFEGRVIGSSSSSSSSISSGWGSRRGTQGGQSEEGAVMLLDYTVWTQAAVSPPRRSRQQPTTTTNRRTTRNSAATAKAAGGGGEELPCDDVIPRCLWSGCVPINLSLRSQGQGQGKEGSVGGSGGGWVDLGGDRSEKILAGSHELPDGGGRVCVELLECEKEGDDFGSETEAGRCSWVGPAATQDSGSGASEGAEFASGGASSKKWVVRRAWMEVMMS